VLSRSPSHTLEDAKRLPELASCRPGTGTIEGVARVRCPDCRHEFLVAFSCKLRGLCPSCHQKRELLWVAWAEEELLEARTLEDRTALLMTLMGIELDTTSRHQSPSPPTINYFTDLHGPIP